MHSLFNPVQKRLATLEADSAPVANPEPRLPSRLVVVVIIIIIIIIIRHAFTRASRCVGGGDAFVDKD